MFIAKILVLDVVENVFLPNARVECFAGRASTYVDVVTQQDGPYVVAFVMPNNEIHVSFPRGQVCWEEFLDEREESAGGL